MKVIEIDTAFMHLVYLERNVFVIIYEPKLIRHVKFIIIKKNILLIIYYLNMVICVVPFFLNNNV